jgi:hypothetical protein
MSRAAFFDALVADLDLNALGINEDSVFPNYSKEERPTDNGPFFILRWNGQEAPMWQNVKRPETLTFWVHYPAELTSDYGRLIKILDAVDDVVKNWRDLAGDDNYTLSFVQIGNRSADFYDDGFNTISKNGTYEVHSRRSV